MEKVSLRILGILGVLIFVPLFLFTFADPQLIERSGQSFVEWKLQSETDKKIDSIKLPAATKLESLLGAKARQVRVQTQLKLEEVKRQLKTDAPAILAGWEVDSEVIRDKVDQIALIIAEEELVARAVAQEWNGAIQIWVGEEDL